MCRWLAYNGPAIRIGDLLFEPANSLVHQSIAARELGEDVPPVNGDGFGLGWYDEHDTVPSVYHSVKPAWLNRNLRELTRNLRSSTFLAHVRAATAGVVQEANCHPFRHGKVLFQHNGSLFGFGEMRRELMLAIDPSLYNSIEGTTDSEWLFHMALSFGLEDDPLNAMQQAVGFYEQTGERLGVADTCVQMTVAVTDGPTVWVMRYATHGTPRTLYHSTDVPTLKELCPYHPDVQALHSGEVHMVVSEPLDDLPGNWEAVTPGSFVTMADGQAEAQPFNAAVPA